jgi:hypothetical protein
VTIHGFDIVKDKLVFVNTTNHTVYSETEFKVLPGVVISPRIPSATTLRSISTPPPVSQEESP